MFEYKNADMGLAKPYIIFEVANSHGGNLNYLNSLIQKYQELNWEKKGIKFQPFKPELIAVPDYEWYDVYKKLFIGLDEWDRIINSGDLNGVVWLDLFDVYGVSVLKEHLSNIFGIKLQASVLKNVELYTELKQLNLSSIELMINVSGYGLNEIDEYITAFKSLKPKKLIIQFGFQRYPTTIRDVGLQKIKILKVAFPDISLCFADHVLAKDDFSVFAPACGYLMGCEYLEKHICLDREETKYDHYSALEFDEVNKMLETLDNVILAGSGLFVSVEEKKYLESSEQKPLTRWDMKKGEMISSADVCFRRTSKSGFLLNEIKETQSKGFILSKDLKKGEMLDDSCFCKASVGVIVACRMKSSRLKDKALLPIVDVPSVEHCLKNCLRSEIAEKVVLATSYLPEDAILGNHLLDGRVEFFKGDPDDVIKRYVAAAEKNEIDVIVRVTADCPVISSEIIDFLVKSHFESGADYSCVNHAAVGTAAEIYNASALRRVLTYMGSTSYSEYMTWYMKNNPEIFKVNIVNLPKEMIREYRLTLDYKEDLEMFNMLFEKLRKKEMDSNLKNIFEVLDADMSLSRINSNIGQRYEQDESLIAELNRCTKIKDMTLYRYFI